MLDKDRLATLRASAIPEAGNRVQLAVDLSEKTQGQVASGLGMRQSQLSDIARGRFPEPKLSTLQKLADYFDCQIEDLFPSTQSQPITIPGVEVRPKADRRTGVDRRGEGAA